MYDLSKIQAGELFVCKAKEDPTEFSLFCAGIKE